MTDALTTFVSSTLGNQWVSSRQSAPSYGFGTSTREHAAKVFISPKHAELSTMPLSPGPAKYGSKSVLGPQLILTSQPSYGMGTSERFNNLPASQRPNAYDMKDSIGGPGGFSMGTSTRQGVEKVYVSEEHSISTFSGVGSPGPATYSGVAGVGKQYSSCKGTEPCWGFGTNERFKDPSLKAAAKQPAPGAYEIASSVGPQAVGRFASAPLFGMGTSTRENMDKVFTSAAQERTKSFGKISPGPIYTLQDSIGPQRLSTKAGAPARGFGSCDRWYTQKLAARCGNTPAPGAYNV